MLQIPCPWCGVRDEEEFRFGGELHLNRPASAASDVDWSNYLFNRENVKGVHYERWLHTFGCGRWFSVARHTVTHEILRAYKIGEPRPSMEADST
jgi:sarcosine oxidase subunit delta